MNHKNIAVLVTALDSDVQAKTLRGIEEFCKNNNCNLAAFVWFTGANEREKHNMGEANIAALPDLSLFDGVIVFSNVLHVQSSRHKIEALLSDLPCPVVCIGDKVGDSYHISTDNYIAMRELVEHIVVDHNIKNIHFVKGVKGNGDAEARYKAYEDVLTEHNIPIVYDRISQGDFYVSGGELAAKEILSSKLPFPEAIICANDMMAITVCDILVEKGYRVPEDVIITGYDYIGEGQAHFPSLTTVKSRFDELGKQACKIIIDVIEGKDVPKDTFLPDEVVLAESCGCKNDSKDIRYSKAFNSTENGQRKLVHEMILLEKNIMESEGFDEWLEAVKEYIRQVNPTEFYMCVNDDFIENIFEIDVLTQEEMSVEEKLEYSQNMNVIVAYKNGTFIKKTPILSAEGFDELFMDTDCVKQYIFSPFHYLDRNFGYFVFVDSLLPIDNPLYVSWVMYMGDGVENIRKQNLLKHAMNRLDEMYIKDSLTGAYNRFGMERFFVEIKRKYMMSKAKLQLSFIDIDNLKKINDEFGHEEGDNIIMTAAKILQKNAGKNHVIRYGGDEFIVMGMAYNEKEVLKYWDKVCDDIDKYNANSNRRAKLSMSYGYDIFDIDAKIRLEDCISVTDKKMYIDKNTKKQKQQ